MKSLNESVIGLFEACVQLSQSLQECFRLERLSLIQFKTDSVLENNLTKDQLLRELSAKRRELKAAIEENLEGQPAETILDDKSLALYRTLENRWNHSWGALYRNCSSNQDFLKHSLRNLDQLSENLSRLFGLHSTYTAKGTRAETKPTGNVVEGRY